MTTSKTFFQPLDRIAIGLMLILSLLIGLLMLQGDAVKPSVRYFSWQNQQIGADNTSFTLTFSRPMDSKSVEENIKIDPPLAGKVSWAGRRMAYTLMTPAPYGTTYKVQLQGARDKFSEKEGKNRQIQPFTGSFHTRDRIILYIGADQQDKGRLVLYNLTQERKMVLTPK
ncbi:MAG: Ig-like domain-containing protein, partial [Brasilonema sp.]